MRWAPCIVIVIVIVVIVVVIVILHLIALRPAHELEQLTRLARRLDSRHQLRQRHDLLVDLENPGPEDEDVLHVFDKSIA